MSTLSCQVSRGRCDAMGLKHQDKPACSIPDCRRRSRASCFECERSYCAYHLTGVVIPFLHNIRGYLVCPACLQAYSEDPVLWSLLILNTAVRTSLKTQDSDK